MEKWFIVKPLIKILQKDFNREGRLVRIKLDDDESQIGVHDHARHPGTRLVIVARQRNRCEGRRQHGQADNTSKGQQSLHGYAPLSWREDRRLFYWRARETAAAC